MNLLHRPCLLFAAVVLGAAVARADTLAGRVIDTNGAGLLNVRVEANGIRVYTLADGTFAMTIAAGRWDVTFNPATTALAPEQRLGVQVSGITNIGDTTLRPGFAVSGTAVDTGNLPIAGCNINVYDTAGQKRYTPNDTTNLAGVFSVIVPAGTWRVRVLPPSFPLRVAREVSNVVVNAATNLGTFVLRPGVQLSAVVVDGTTNAPVADVDVDVSSALTGEKWVTPNDKTSGTGSVSVVVPTGLSHVAFDPPAGAPLLGRQMFNVSIGGPINLGVVALTRGVLLSGTVLGPGSQPVGNVNLDVATALGGYGIYLPNDNTNGQGQFTVCVPAGTYQMSATPPLATGLVGALTAPFTVAANTTLPPIQLIAGVAIYGRLSAWDGQPEPGAAIRVKDPVTGARVVNPGEVTNLAGDYVTVVPNGTWELTFHTRKASLSRVGQVNVTVNGNTAFNYQLQPAPVVCWLGAQGIPTIPAAGLLPVGLAFGNATAALAYTNLSIVLIDPDGVESVLVPPLLLPVPPAFLVYAPVQLPMPPFNPVHLGKIFRMALRCDDPTTGLEQDRDSVQFIIQ